MDFELPEIGKIYQNWKIEQLQELIIEEEDLWKLLIGEEKPDDVPQVFFDLLLMIKENRDKQSQLLWGHNPTSN